MALDLIKLEVGPWPMNSYIVVCPETKTSVIIDPGANADALLKQIDGTNVSAILLTHGHPDHVGALDEVKQQTQAPVYLHPADASHFGIVFDIALKDGDQIQIGNSSLQVIYTPGHTPGQCSFDLGDGRIIVGDTVFVGGPGRTWSSADFALTIDTMKNTVFQWPDETIFYPGHGPAGKIGTERPAFEQFTARGWADTCYGDVSWELPR